MTQQHYDTPRRDERIEKALDEYFASGDQQDTVTPDMLLQRYPEIQRELAAFFDTYQQLLNFAVPPNIDGSLDFLSEPRTSEFLGCLRNYDIICKVGNGNMGIVLRARECGQTSEVAIKVLVPQLVPDARALRRFFREYRAVAALRHPNVVAVFDFVLDNYPPFIVMEFIDGMTLQARIDEIRAGRPLPVAEILAIGRGIASGLQCAHSHGLVHRDVKPANILLSRVDHQPRLGDFGLVRPVRDCSIALTSTGNILGTPQFMSPEQASGGQVDDRSDLFSLGSVFYAMCTGTPPFSGASSYEVMRNVIHSRPRTIADIAPDIPFWLVHIVDRLHATRPADRFSADELVTELSRHIDRVSLQRQHAATVSFPSCHNQPFEHERQLYSMTDQAVLREELTEIQKELSDALDNMLVEIGRQLDSDERTAIRNEFEQLHTLLERLKTGLIWIALFGKVNVGKSAVANALIEEDRASVHIAHDHTPAPGYYEKRPWKIVDVPGVMGDEILEDVAISEAKKAHAHIFVVDGEPFGPELRLFETVQHAMPDSPKIVFVNKWDIMALGPAKNRDVVASRIASKMGKFVRAADDIVYGNAEAYDREQDKMVRQKLPQLLDRMYDDAGTFGEMMNVLDPARRAANLTSKIRERVFEVRQRVARRVIAASAGLSAAAGFVPFNQLLIDPGILATMVFMLMKIMGKDAAKGRAKEIASELLKNCGIVLGAEFVALAVADFITGVGFVVLGPFGAAVAALANVAGLGYLKYRRTAILGEVTLEYIRHDFSWGDEDPRQVILRCKDRAQQIYVRLGRKRD